MINENSKQHSGEFIRKIGGWGKYYKFLKSQKNLVFLNLTNQP